MRSYPSWIAGLRYRGPDGTNRGRYCCGLQVGTTLQLVPEPSNPYSKHAVAVVHQGHHLGYIPERHDWVASAIAEGHRLSCSVRKVEVEGWFFRRASLVGLQVTVEDGHDFIGASAGLEQNSKLEKAAREACIDGLRVLAFIAMADNDVTPDEVKIELSYIQARLTMLGVIGGSQIDAMLALSQGLSVTKRSLTRAVNRVAADREHYRLILHAALQLTDLGGDPKGVRVEALQRIKKAGKAKGWI
jgi:HIRAN domain